VVLLHDDNLSSQSNDVEARFIGLKREGPSDVDPESSRANVIGVGRKNRHPIPAFERCC
jgi:hypothetical protein